MCAQPNDEVLDDVGPPPLTAVTGWHSVLPVPEHPIAAWLDLMDVVEALCPEWPRPTPMTGTVFRL